MGESITTNRCIEAIPDYAYAWRPYASEAMIYKPVQTQRGEFVFIIDPWTQRWIIAEASVAALLKLADGRRRLAEIIRLMTNDHSFEPPSNGFVGLAQELVEMGMLTNCRSEHRSSGLPIYNQCEPIGLHLEITNACNMTCSHCYVSSGKKLPGEMTIEEIYKAIDMLPPFTGKRVAISGGEPAVRKDCADIIEYCAVRCGHSVDLYTNGKNFPRQLAERILELQKRTTAMIRIQVSLEGATAATSDLVRGQGSFDAAIQSLEMFKQMRLNRSTVLFVCLTKANINEVDDLIRIAEKYDVSMLVFSQWQKQGNASSTPWSLIAPTLEEWVTVGEKLLNYNNPRLQVFGNFYGDLHNTSCGSFSLDDALFPKHLYFYNAFPRITPQGKIFADQLWVDPEWIIGDVQTNTLDKCFESPKFHEQLELMRKRAQNIDKCQSCEWRSLCEGGSPGHTYAEYGHMNEKDLFCDARIYWFNRFVEHKIKQTCGN